MTLPFLGYLLASLVVGFVLTIFVSMFRSTKKADEFKPMYWILGFSVLAGLAPYAYVEYLTRQAGAQLESPIKRALVSAQVAGKMEYFRVLSHSENDAKVVAVAKERGSFGEPERTVLQIELRRKSGKWSPRNFEFVNSYKRQKDGTTLPPYW
jgi:hypothetical protein